jgi:serine/threonine protein kinase/tetratricopeptide (TPR) repeat protein
VLALIGVGGMGEVYRAHDSRLGRDVALKMLPAQASADAEMRARFEHEARAVAAISHQNILSIHELAEIDGQPVAVVELLEGESLRDRLQRGPMPWRDAVQMAARIADGLAAAHAKGIVHRDLKPENIFVTEDQRPKILDFGLAQSDASRSLTDSGITLARTEPGRVLGTIGYMAPEQVRGETAGAAADIFAFGCTLAEMLSGQKPFVRATVAESLAAVLHDQAPDLIATGSDIPPRLNEIVAHCLEKDVSRRFGSARDVAAALRSLLTESHPGSDTANRTGRRVRRTRAVAVLPFACEVLNGGTTTEYLADGVTESIINSLSQLPKLRVVPRSTVFAYKGRPVVPRSVGLALNVDVLVTGRVVQYGETLSVQSELLDVESERQVWGDQYRYPTSDLLSLQEQIAWQISEALRVQLTGEEKKRLRRRLEARPTQSSEAYDAYLRGRHAWGKWTEEGFREAIRHFEAAIARDPKYAQAYSGLGDSYAILGYYGHLPPELAMTRAAAAAYKALELNPSLADAQVTMGLTRMFYYWDWIGAEQALKTAIQLDPRLPFAYTLLGLLNTMLCRQGDGLALARKARELDPLSLVAQMGVVWTLFFSRRYREALDALRDLAIIDPDYPEARNMMVIIYECLGLFERAAEAFGTGLRFGIRTDFDATALLREGYAKGGERGYWLARREILRRVDARAERLGPDAMRISPVFHAMMESRLGHADEAFAAIDRAIAQRAGHIAFMLVDPFFDPIRSDPRFDAVVRRMGYPSAVSLA